ncbi:hypothetical protein BRADI_1g34522v3 [Brachypodium distachyon]|uniref:Uncharacterized protein n=1 Tax=Brachypodium distachyon TaxID=15368 RepID=A0A0Q3H3L7_BRADI|nr:hypothetical protein BRADI_1g34522v3 [Brachypodium distachyon]
MYLFHTCHCCNLQSSCSSNPCPGHICIGCPTSQPRPCHKEETCSCSCIRWSIWNPQFSTKTCCDRCKKDHTEEEEKILKSQCTTGELVMLLILLCNL